MGDHNYYTALSHAVLAGTSIYCLLEHMTDMGIVCYGLIATNSLIGLWRWGNPDAGSTSKSVYDTTAICQEVVCLGAVAAEIWGAASPFYPQFWWAQLILPVIPLGGYFLDKDYQDLEKAFMTLNGISIAVVAVMSSNWWALAATASYLWGYLYAKDQGSIQDIPARDLINYELCFFCYFALKALAEN